MARAQIKQSTNVAILLFLLLTGSHQYSGEHTARGRRPRANCLQARLKAPALSGSAEPSPDQPLPCERQTQAPAIREYSGNLRVWFRG